MRTDSSKSASELSPASAARLALAQVALEELEVDIERVERVAELMRHAGGEERDGVHFFRLDRFAGLGAAGGEVVEDEGEAHERGVLVVERHEVEM